MNTLLKKGKKVISDEPLQKKTLLLWPGVIAVILQWLIRFGIPIAMPGGTSSAIGVFGGLIGGLIIFVWWGFFSRAPRAERWGAIILMIVVLAGTSRIVDESIATAQIGLTFFIYAIPLLSLAFVIWAVTSRNLPDLPRRITMVATILLSCGVWTLVRTEGMTSDIGHDFAWRWSETSEERLMVQAGDEPKILTQSSGEIETGAGWPGFRGPNRDGIIRGVKINTDWIASPPVELWRRAIGPGWSSFAILGDFVFTQEQRGDDEAVTCYNLTNGDQVWRHSNAARFMGADANPGPRATPTLIDGRIYTFGATGIVNVLDAVDGAVVWSRNATSDTDTDVPIWGFSSSPLVFNDIVIVHVASKLLAYDLITGDPLWIGAVGTGYSSPHLITIDGVSQILLQSGVGLTSFNPANGSILWEHAWPEQDRILQPALTMDSDIILSTVLKDIRCISVDQEPGGWTLKELWTSNQMKSNFNDFVVHEGYAFGFDGLNLVCIDLNDGKRKWRGGRYGGQCLLMADQDLLLVLSERGDLSLVEATSEKFTELARFPAIRGKTWNHPVLTGNVLIVRNSEEMAAFRLSLEGTD